MPASISNLLMSVIVCKRTKDNSANFANSEKNFVSYGIQTSFWSILPSISEQVERILIFTLTDPSILALYFAGDRISELVRSVFQDISSTAAPSFAKLNYFSHDIKFKLRWFCGVSGIVIILIALTIAPLLLLMIFGESYKNAVPLAQVLLISTALGNYGQFQWRFIRSQQDIAGFRKISLSTSIIRIFVALIMIPVLGVWGGCYK